MGLIDADAVIKKIETEICQNCVKNGKDNTNPWCCDCETAEILAMLEEAERK